MIHKLHYIYSCTRKIPAGAARWVRRYYSAENEACERTFESLRAETESYFGSAEEVRAFAVPECRLSLSSTCRSADECGGRRALPGAAVVCSHSAYESANIRRGRWLFGAGSATFCRVLAVALVMAHRRWRRSSRSGWRKATRTRKRGRRASVSTRCDLCAQYEYPN